MANRVGRVKTSAPGARESSGHRGEARASEFPAPRGHHQSSPAARLGVRVLGH